MMRYLALMVSGAFAICMLAGAFNWTIDPYWIWKSPAIRGLNEFKPAVRDNIRLFKLSARRFRPEAVILGTSRADDGLDPGHPTFKGRTAFNLAAPAQTYEESLELLNWVTREFNTKIVVLTLDFFVANAYSKIPNDFRPGNTNRIYEAQLMFSLDTLSESIRTILDQPLERSRAASPGKFNNYREDGLRVVGSEKAKGWGGHRNAFNAVELNMLDEAYLPPPKCAFVFEDKKSGRYPLRALANLFAEAHVKGIDLRLAISPIHARLVEAKAQAGLWSSLESWKRRIVEANELAAKQASRAPFPLWDFSGYSELTTETVPATGDAASQMTWYWESSHYKKAAGNIMLTRMFENSANTTNNKLADFGIPLTAANIESALSNIRNGRARFRESHAEDIREIENSVSQARLNRKSRGCLQ